MNLLRRRRKVSHLGIMLSSFLRIQNFGGEVAAEQQQIGGVGFETRISDYTWFTAILRVEDLRFWCGGTLIGSRHVITANHCVAAGARTVVVQVSYYCPLAGNCGRSSQFVRVKESFSVSGGDMALLVLDDAVSPELNIQPAVPFLGNSFHPSQHRGKNMRLIGGGQTGRFSSVSDYVFKVRVTRLSRKKCSQSLSDPSKLTDFMVCSVVKDSGFPCNGDSGGAVVVRGRGEKWKGRDIVMAIHNAGPSDCDRAVEGRPLLHFRMQDAAGLLQLVICGGEFPEDWCDGVETSEQQDMAQRNTQPQLVCSDGSLPYDPSLPATKLGPADADADADDAGDNDLGLLQAHNVTSPLKRCKDQDDVDVEFMLDSDHPTVVRKCRWLRNLRRLYVYCASEKSNARIKCPARCDWNCM